MNVGKLITKACQEQRARDRRLRFLEARARVRNMEWLAKQKERRCERCGHTFFSG